MFYVYAIKSLADHGLYIGCTGDLKNRIRSHDKGSVESTKKRLPIELIYYEACTHRDDAFRREKYLKTTYGRRYIKQRLKNYFTGWTEGYRRGHRKEYVQFLYMAHGSCGELETLLSLSFDLGLIDKDTFEKLYPMQEEISKLLRGLISSLNKSKGWLL